jgi:hypothetical protein
MHADLVDALGGYVSLADTLTEQTGRQFDPRTVHKWKANGVPYRWRPLVAQLAKARSIALPKGFSDPLSEAA